MHNNSFLTSNVSAVSCIATLEAKLIQQIALMRYEFMYTLFMNLHKVYDALERDRCMEILEGYGMGARSHDILWVYWDCLQMVSCIGGYYGTGFEGFWGVTQGYPLPPTIINVVEDSVVRHWALVMVY